MLALKCENNDFVGGKEVLRLVPSLSSRLSLKAAFKDVLRSAYGLFALKRRQFPWPELDHGGNDCLRAPYLAQA